MMGPNLTVVALLILTLTILVLLYWFNLNTNAAAPVRRRPPPPSCAMRPAVHRPPPPAEYYTAPAAAVADLRALLDFSDVFITEERRREAAEAVADTEQIQSVNDRFQAAKRSVTEYKLKTGVFNQKQRRKVVETLLRRPHCGRRVRSWRTENSDFLRGDPRPRVSGNSSNIIRSAKNDPDVDLHPGALGPMAGMAGRWLSEENLPGNLVPEGLVEG